MAELLKKRRVSKKNKKAWRKHTNVKDVEEFLIDLREEERLGKPFENRTNNELFSIDNTPSKHDADRDVLPKSTSEIENSNSGHSYRLKVKDLKCLALLNERTAVPDPVIKRNRVRTNEEKKEPLVRRQQLSLAARGVFKIPNKTRIESRKITELKRREARKVKDLFTRDIWEEKDKVRELEGHAHWLSSDAVRHNLHNTGHKMKSIPRQILMKTSALPVIEVPHPGTSYNPLQDDHNELLSVVVEKEKEIIKEEKHINRVTTQMFNKCTELERDEQYFNDMMSFHLMPDDEVSVTDSKVEKRPVLNKKKTLKKRRSLREATKLKEQLKQRKIEKKKVSDIYKLRKFQESITEQESLYALVAEKRSEAKEQKVFATKKLSKVKYEEPELDFNMPLEVTGTLRGIQPVGSLLADRYKSMQKRNILEPALKRKPKKGRKKKRYEIPSYKMGWEPKGY